MKLLLWLILIEGIGTGMLNAWEGGNAWWFGTPYQFRLISYPLGNALWLVLHYLIGVDVSWL